MFLVVSVLSRNSMAIATREREAKVSARAWASIERHAENSTDGSKSVKKAFPSPSILWWRRRDVSARVRQRMPTPAQHPPCRLGSGPCGSFRSCNGTWMRHEPWFLGRPMFWPSKRSNQNLVLPGRPASQNLGSRWIRSKWRFLVREAAPCPIASDVACCVTFAGDVGCVLCN